MKNLPNILLITFISIFTLAGLCTLLLLTGHMINAKTPLPKLLFTYGPFFLILPGLAALIWRIILIKKTTWVKWVAFGFVILTLLFLLLGTLRSVRYQTLLTDYYLVFFLVVAFAILIILKKPENQLPCKIAAGLFACIEVFIIVLFVYNMTTRIFLFWLIIMFPLFLFCCLYFIKLHTIPWLRWVCLGVCSLLQIFFIIQLILHHDDNYITANNIFLTIVCIFTVVLTLILFIRTHRWTRFVFSFYILLTVLGITGFTISRLAIVQNSYNLYYADRAMIMQHKKLKNKKVIYQEHTKGSSTRKIYIEEKFLFFRKEKKPDTVKFTGAWYEYDTSGNFLQLYVYAENGTLTFQGNVDEDKVVFPETPEKLLKVVNNITPDQIIELNDEYVIRSDLEIAGKSNFTITPIAVTQIRGELKTPLIMNPENTRGGFVLKECKNVIIDGLHFNLSNKTAHYPGIISLYKCSNVQIKNCYIQGSAEYGIYIHNSCRDIAINSNDIKGYRQFGCFTDYGTSFFSVNSYENSNRIYISNIHLTKNDFMQIYKESFASIYSHIYDRDLFPGLSFDTYTIGMYMGTPGSIGNDSGMSSAAKDFFTSKGLVDVSHDFLTYLLEQISGIPVYAEEEERNHESPWYLDEYEMAYWNPEFITWVGNNLVPEPYDGILGVTYQQLYTYCYRRLFLALAEAYRYIENNLDIEEEIPLFIDAIHNQGTPRYYLEERFFDMIFDIDSELLPDFEDYGYYDGYEGYYDGEYGYEGEYFYGMMFGFRYYNPYEIFAIDLTYLLTPPKAFGFWFRRYIDETRDEVWQVITDILTKYEK